MSNGTYHGTDTIGPIIGRILTTELVELAIDISRGHDEDEEIGDDAALTIASWWMSPGPDGGTFSALVHGHAVSLESFADDLSRAFDAATGWDFDALGYLATWALNHGTRRTPAEVTE